MPQNNDVDEKLAKLIATDGDESKIRNAVTEVFKDEAISMRNMILAISRAKLTLIEKMMSVATAMGETFTDADLALLKQEFGDEPLSERIRMFKVIVDSIMTLSASSSYVLDLEAALTDFERQLIPAETSTSEKQLFKKVMEEIGRVINSRAQEVKFREIENVRRGGG